MDPRPAFPRLTGTADVSVRPAVAADAAEVARVQGDTWRTAYADVLPPAALEGWDAAAAEAAWRAAITAPPTAAHGVLVALDDGRVVGFAAFGPAELSDGEQPHPAGPTTELAVLLVEPRWGRRGHGSRLLAAVADLAAGTGAARLTAWVPEADRVTAGFLESAGWDRDGRARTLDAAGVPLREVRWHTLLGGDA
ncbi:GNAT family N-acetyltransferase [Geodermatophilus arenarius]|uniref:GNAT family N-acetyltransferase n=1 Tax=Geodermatophilus arenarius TaxID=1137990 RepID=A0ABV9LS32_9ACTN